MYGLWIYHPRIEDTFTWKYRTISWTGGREVVVPLWLIAFIPSLTTAWLWYRDRRQPGRCTDCNYDLTGLATGSACPECGKASTITSPVPEKP